jgi:NAD(P)-dependent dehydrogenase (short-subunit alcohol dehydrogenase family)
MTVTVITGSSTGIGYATALRLASDGHSVVATMRNPDASDLASVSKDRGLDIETRPLDVGDGAAIDALFRDVIAARGAVDVLVNNAGVGEGGVVEETDLETYRRVMETNFFGALACTKAVLPSMREQGSGCVVNVTSQAGQLAMPNMSPYCASKWALEALSESLAVEVAPFGIRVAVIEPGMILTPIWGKVDMTMPTGPYAPVRIRLGGVVLEEMKHGSTAEEVADCIAEAIATDEPKLRWLVGHGAERNVRNRGAVSDERMIELWNGPDEPFRAYCFDDPYVP